MYYFIVTLYCRPNKTYLVLLDNDDPELARKYFYEKFDSDGDYGLGFYEVDLFSGEYFEVV